MTTRFSFAVVLSAVLIFTLGGCPSSDPEPAASAASADAAAPEAGGEQVAAQVRIVNDSGYTMLRVHISPSSESEWGDDLLGATEVIESGKSKTLSVPAAGTYDIRLFDEDGDTYTRKDVEVNGTFEWTVTLDYLD
jgi:uncharacterized protein YfaS (alpha-2-macroglobulin family)